MIEKTGKQVSGITADTADYLERQAWIGNVRELENWIHKMFVRTPEKQPIKFEDTESATDLDTNRSLKNEVEKLEVKLIQEALGKVRGNVSVAARRLGMSRSGLQKKMTKYKVRKQAD